MPGILDSFGDFTLVFGASTGLPAWSDLSRFIDKAGYQIYVFVINYQIFVAAKLAKLGTGEIAPATFTAISRSGFAHLNS